MLFYAIGLKCCLFFSVVTNKSAKTLSLNFISGTSVSIARRSVGDFGSLL